VGALLDSLHASLIMLLPTCLQAPRWPWA